MKIIVFLSSILVIHVLLVSCTTSGLPTEKPPSQETQMRVSQTTTKEAWEIEWENTIIAAKKEGKVSVINAGNMVAARDALTNAFKERYGIDIDFTSGSGAQVSAKLLNERRAGLYLVDVYVGGATTIVTLLIPKEALDPLKPLLILPEVTDAKLWWSGEPLWIDKGKRALGFIAYSSTPITINSDLVKENEVKSYRDILDPKWKGKIVMDDPTRPGSTLKWFGVLGSKVLGLDYMRQFAKQEPVIMRDSRLSVEWLARGRSAIGVTLYDVIITEFKDAGAHLTKVSLSEGTYMTVDGGTLAVVNQAPHPNAAKLFINWLMTKEGQTISSKAINLPSARLDVPTQHIDPLYLLKPGVDYIRADVEELLLAQTEQAKIALEIFGNLVR